MYAKILELDQSIRKNTFRVRRQLWSGAGVQVTEATLVRPESGVIQHQDAFAISTLVDELKHIIDYDYLDKFELFGRLLENLPTEGALGEMILRSKKLYWERTENLLLFVPEEIISRYNFQKTCPRAIRIPEFGDPEIIVPSGAGDLWEIPSACKELLRMTEMPPGRLGIRWWELLG